MSKRTISQRISSILFFAIVFLFLVSSCSDEISYNKSADVHQQGWTPADVLLFEFGVSDSIPKGMYDVLARNHRYNLSVSVRYSEEYRFTTIPLHIEVDESKKYKVNPQLLRKSSWGSLFQDEFLIKGVPISFPDTGRHTIVIYPDTTLEGIYSLGVDIR